MKLIPTITIPIGEYLYVYPKIRLGKQNLMKLDKIGKLFYENLKQYMDDSTAIENITKVFINADVEKIKIDYNAFKNKLKKAGFLIDNNDINVVSEENNSISEERYVQELLNIQQTFTQERKPYKFFIELTYNCNLRCAHCYREEEIRENYQEYLEKEKIYSVLDEIEEIGAVEVVFTGGECFTHPKIYEILEYATKKNLIVTILTNGNFIDEITIEKLQKIDIYDIRVSIYGMQEKHDFMTHIQGSWKKSVRALELIKEKKGIGTAVFVITKNNYEDTEDVIEFFRQKDISLSLNTMITPTAKGKLNPTEMRINSKEYEELLNKYNLPVSGSRCTAGISRFRIIPNGNVIPCELIEGNVLGNIYAQSIKEIMEGEKKKYFEEAFSSILKTHYCVTQCEYKSVCNFCPAIFLIENNDINKPVKYICDMSKIKKEHLRKRGIRGKENGKML